MGHPLEYALVLAAVAANTPFGMWRAAQRRYSAKWFLAIHLPIPLIFVLRVSAGYSYTFIPWLFLGAVTGQILGGRIYELVRQRRLAPEPAPPAAD
jgi:hypothetical protein